MPSDLVPISAVDSCVVPLDAEAELRAQLQNSALYRPAGFGKRHLLSGFTSRLLGLGRFIAAQVNPAPSVMSGMSGTSGTSVMTENDGMSDKTAT